MGIGAVADCFFGAGAGCFFGAGPVTPLPGPGGLERRSFGLKLDMFDDRRVAEE
jgi:hypothetical protein